ncbi:MAG TPA: hypothetical protein VGQ19_18350 [Burkholderiales bacterium]|jgi:hypothetical protein|nr:hypothetical protein [Burkholderiales bacterium]
MVEEVKLMVEKRSAVNRHKVPQRQWRKWTLVARKVFNEVYSTMAQNQWTFLHPHQDKVSKRLWKTTAWNAAWIAADATRG